MITVRARSSASAFSLLVSRALRSNHPETTSGLMRQKYAARSFLTTPSIWPFAGSVSSLGDAGNSIIAAAMNGSLARAGRHVAMKATVTPRLIRPFRNRVRCVNGARMCMSGKPGRGVSSSRQVLGGNRRRAHVAFCCDFLQCVFERLEKRGKCAERDGAAIVTCTLNAKNFVLVVRRA